MPMKRDAKERIVDWLLVALMVLPFVLSMTLKVLLKPAGEGISITGAQVYFTIPMPVMDLPITESQVNSLMVVLSILGLCLYLTHGISVAPHSKRQIVAEWIVEKVQNMVNSNMGAYFSAFAPFLSRETHFLSPAYCE